MNHHPSAFRTCPFCGGLIVRLTNERVSCCCRTTGAVREMIGVAVVVFLLVAVAVMLGMM